MVTTTNRTNPDTSAEADAMSTTAAKSRSSWEKIFKKPTGVSDGKPTFEYPFLCESNRKDMLFTRLLLEEKPWEAAYGQILESWSAFTEKLRVQVDSDGKKPLEKVSAKSVKERFEKLIAVAKDITAMAKKATGADDEESMGELQENLEIILTLYNTHLNSAGEKDLAAAAKKENDRAAAERIKVASLYGKNTTSNVAVKENPDIASPPTAKKQRLGARSGLDHMVSVMQTSSERMETRAEILLAKEKRKILQAENKARQLELQKSMMALLEKATNGSSTNDATKGT